MAIAESCSSGTCALHRHAAQLGDGDVVARDQLLHGGCRNAHAEDGRTVAQAQKDRAWIGSQLHRLFDAKQHARPVRLLSHQKRVAVDHIGAGVALAFQREQLFVIGAQMRCAIENMRNESGLASGYLSNADICSTQPDLAAKRADEILNFLGVMRQWRHHAPDRARPGRVAGAARDDMDVQLRHQIAEGCDVQFVALGNFLQKRATRLTSVINCACPTSSRSMISTASTRRGTSSSQG